MQKGKISQDRIISAANKLFYEQGYNLTSVSDIATEVGITKGNLHYHFNSKDELLEAVINHRLEIIVASLEQWEREFQEPDARLKRFVKMVLNQEADILRFGCPMGSLTVELGKCQQPLKTKARTMFDKFANWLEKVFRQMGRKDSKALSKHLLAMVQGAALMSYVYADRKILKRECKEIEKWIDSLSC